MPEITQEEFDMLEAYKQLGSIDELSSKQFDTVITTAAESSGFKKTVLERLLKTLPSEYNLVSSEDGVAMSTPDGDIDLKEFAEKEWAEFMPSLKAGEEKAPISHVRQSATPRETGKREQSKKITAAHIANTYGWALKSDSVN